MTYFSRFSVLYITDAPIPPLNTKGDAMRSLMTGLKALAAAGTEFAPAPARTMGGSVDGPDVRRLRARLMMSQGLFATSYGIPLPTLRQWERGTRRPDATARAYLSVIARDPDGVAAIFAGTTTRILAGLRPRELLAALDAADRKAAAAAAAVTPARR